MPGTVKQFVDYSNNTANDTGENNAASIQPIVDGNPANAANLSRPDESLRQRTEAVRSVFVDSLYLRDADRTLVVTGPGLITWPGSTTAAQTGIPVISDTLYLLPMLTPGFAQAAPIPPVASAFGVLHLKRADSLNSILVTGQRRSYAYGDQINITVTPGGGFSCTLDVETPYQRTIHIVATGATQLSTVITALNALTPLAPDNTALVTAVLEGGALGTDLLLTTQAKQYVAGNYDGEGHAITPANLAAFFTGNPTQALAEGDTLCVVFAMVSDTASTGGRRQALPENANTAVPVGSFFNSRSHPEKLTNALPICKVVNNRLVFGTGSEIAAGSVNTDLSTTAAASISYGGGGIWADGTTNPATTVEVQLDKIISDLAGATGTGKIKGSAVGGDLAAETLALQIADLVNGWFKLSRAGQVVSGANTFSAQQTFSALQALNGANDSSFSWGSDTPPNAGTGRPKPVWYAVLDTAAGIKLRYYATKKSGLMVTVNALVTGMSGADVTYIRDAAAWTDTTAATAARMTMSADGTWHFQFLDASITGVWDDTNWVSYGLLTSAGFTATALKFSTPVSKVIPNTLAFEVGGTAHTKSVGGMIYALSPNEVYWPLVDLNVGDVITQVLMDFSKNTTGGGDVVGYDIVKLVVGVESSVTGAPGSQAGSPGAVALAKSGAFTVLAGALYYWKITPANSVTGAADRSYDLTLSFRRP